MSTDLRLDDDSQIARPHGPSPQMHASVTACMLGSMYALPTCCRSGTHSSRLADQDGASLDQPGMQVEDASEHRVRCHTVEHHPPVCRELARTELGI